MQRSVTTDSFKLDFSLESPQWYLITGLIKPFCAVLITIKRFLQFNPFISSCPFGPPPKTHHPFWRSNTEKDILRGKAENWKPISSSHHPWKTFSLLKGWNHNNNKMETNEPKVNSSLKDFPIIVVLFFTRLQREMKDDDDKAARMITYVIRPERRPRKKQSMLIVKKYYLILTE